MKKAIKKLIKDIVDLDDVEMTLSSDEPDVVDIYWNNVRVLCAPSKAKEAIGAIKTLQKLGSMEL